MSSASPAMRSRQDRPVQGVLLPGTLISAPRRTSGADRIVPVALNALGRSPFPRPNTSRRASRGASWRAPLHHFPHRPRST
jgi:hypothetical protein